MSVDQQVAPTPASSALNFSGLAGEITPIVIKNLLLNIVTLGFYRFWGRTNVRRYLWQHINLFGTSLEYTGTGGELFKGFLVITFAIFVPYFALFAILQSMDILSQVEPNPIFEYLTLFGVLFLIGIAIHRARRYRLSRTRWRGIRGAVTGSSMKYGLMFLGHTLLLLLTLGWWLPMRNVQLWKVLINQSFWGDRPFQFEGSARDLYVRFAICWVLFIPTFGLSYVWYKSRELSTLMSGVRYENCAFKLEIAGTSLFGLYFINYLITIVTLGLGLPFTQLRQFRFLIENTTIVGEPDFDAILQNLDTGPSSGEGLADAFDMGAV